MGKLSLMLAVSALCVCLSFQDNHGGGMGGSYGMDGGRGMGGSRGRDGSYGMDGGYGMDRGMGQRRRKGGCGGESKKDSIKEMMMMMMLGGMGGGMGGGCGGGMGGGYGGGMGGGCGGGGQGGGINPMVMYMMMNQMMGGDQDRDSDRDDRDDRDRRPERPDRPQPRPQMHLPCRVEDSEGAAISRECGMKRGEQQTCDVGPIEHESSGWSLSFCTLPCPTEQDEQSGREAMMQLGMTEREMMGMHDGDRPNRQMPDGKPVTAEDRFMIKVMIAYARNAIDRCYTMPTMRPTMAGGN